MHAPALRTNWCKKLPGGVSQITRDILRNLFLGEEGLANSRLVLPLSGGDTSVEIVFGALLADEEAINAMMHSKGASGTCPCILDSVVDKQNTADRELGIRSLADLDPSIQDIACSDLTLCGMRSDEDIWELCDKMAASDKDSLKELQMCYGLKFNQHTLLFDTELRRVVKPASSITYDPMHVLFSNGCLCEEIMDFFRQLKGDHGAHFAAFREFQEETGWLPRTLIFNEKQAKKKNANMLKCSASDLLAAYPMLRAFIHETYGANALEPHVVSILKCMECCDQVRLLLHGGLDSYQTQAIADRMNVSVKAYMEARVAAYGRDSVRFKHHQLLHVPGQTLRSGRMLSCWVTERKNKSALEAMVNCNTNLGVSTNGLARMFTKQIRMLEQPAWRSELSRGKPFPEMACALAAESVHIARCMRWMGVRLASGQAVFCDFGRRRMIVIVACLSIDSSFSLLVRSCVRLSGTELASTWRVDPPIVRHRLSGSMPLFSTSHTRFLAADSVEVLH